jgi:alpha-D-ribose 1-methylphosphonate 5-triphosphate synthase subunit PhnH
MQVHALEGGFADAPIEAAQAFRGVMTAMARPGVICQLAGARPPAPLSLAAGVVVLTLCDPDTPVYLAPSRDSGDIRDWITFHTGAPFVAAPNAVFAIGAWDELPLDSFALGTAEYPDRSATLIVETDHLIPAGHTLTGPGIQTSAQLSLPDTTAFTNNAQHFPMGLDFFFTCGDQIAGLPRTTRISAPVGATKVT